MMYLVGGLQAPAMSLPVRHNQRTSDVEHATMTVAPTSGGQFCTSVGNRNLIILPKSCTMKCFVGLFCVQEMLPGGTAASFGVAILFQWKG